MADDFEAGDRPPSGARQQFSALSVRKSEHVVSSKPGAQLTPVASIVRRN